MIRGGQKRYGLSPPGAHTDVCAVLNRSSAKAEGVDQTQGTTARGREWGVSRELAGWRAKPRLAPGLQRSAGARPSSTQGHLSPGTWAFAALICSETGKRNQAALIKITHPGLELMNIQQPASGGQLRSGRAHLGDCGCVTGARLCRHRHAPPPAWEGSCHGELGRLFCEAAEAQEGAAGAHHPQECRGGAEAQVGTAHEEPGETGRGLKALPSPKPLPFQRLWELAGPLPLSLNAGTQEPKPRVSPWEGIGEPKTAFCCGLASRA